MEDVINSIASVYEKLGMIGAEKTLQIKPFLKAKAEERAIEALASGGRRRKSIAAAYGFTDAIDPYSPGDFRKLHILLSYGVNREGGVIGDGKEKSLEKLFDKLIKEKGEKNALLSACEFCDEVRALEPFNRDNDVMARLWLRFLLKDYREVFRYIPYGKGEAALDIVEQGLADFMAMSEEGGEELFESTYVERMLQLMETGVPYTSKEILGLLGLRSKETLRAHYIDPAVELGLLRMTLPDKPTSKNQRYVKK